VTLNPQSKHEKYWSRLSGAYDSFYQSEWSKFEDSQLLEWLTAACIDHDGCALDLGCGTGLGYQLLRQAAPRLQYQGIDISAEMLSRLREKFPEAQARLMSIDELHSIPNCEYQVVMALNSVLSFSSDVAETLHQAFRILAPGGTLLVSALNKHSLRRLVSLRFGPIEAFSTRNSGASAESVPAHVLSATCLRTLASDVGFESPVVMPQGILAGVLERRFAIPLERGLQRIIPRLSHCLYLHARRPRL
jgi:ubiquinone/menaquinone biosynthesis C-methylase UbiE